jgi:pimeloyl-ACP methyl ester carboxylesterase
MATSNMATNAMERPAEAARQYGTTNADMGEEKWLDVNGIRTRYFDQGEGERVVMIHGAQFGAKDGASSARTWALNFPALKAWHNVIAFDKLGQGYTDNPKSDADYTMHAIVQHAIAFLEKLGKKPYHLVGHSRGGYVVTRISLERPDLVKTCVCVSSGSLSPGQSRTHLVFKDPPQPQLTRESIRWYCERYSYNPKIVTDERLNRRNRAQQDRRCQDEQGTPFAKTVPAADGHAEGGDAPVAARAWNAVPDAGGLGLQRSGRHPRQRHATGRAVHGEAARHRGPHLQQVRTLRNA